MRDFIHAQWSLMLAEDQGVYLENGRSNRTRALAAAEATCEDLMERQLQTYTGWQLSCLLYCRTREGIPRRKCSEYQSSISISIVGCGIVFVCSGPLF